MAWVRECGEALWRLTANSDATRAGYYYWADEGTPHFPHLHHFGPSIWYSDEETGEEPLGQVPGTWKRSDGVAPALIPAPRTVGETDCFVNGERVGLPVVPFTPGTPGMTLPLECYRKADLAFDTNVFDCRFRWYAAEIIRLAYTDTAAAKDFAQDYFGNAALVDVIPAGAEEFFPQAILVRRFGEAYLFTTGTQTPMQWMGHAWTAADGMLDQGAYATGLLSELATRRTLGYAIAILGGDVPTRWLFCGHSWGGQISYIAAAKVRIGPSGAAVDLLTFGMNKPGDQRLIDIVAPSRQVHVVNALDPVPYLPTNKIFRWVEDLLPDAIRLRWQAFRRPQRVWYIPLDGPARWMTDEEIEPNVLAGAAALLQQLALENPGSTHKMEAYSAALRLGCPHLIVPYPVGAEQSYFPLCDPAANWPVEINCLVSFGELSAINLTFLHTFTGGGVAAWTCALPADIVMIDLFSGDTTGQITVRGGGMTYVCGDDHLSMELDIVAPFGVAGHYNTPFTTRNPLRWDVELIAGGGGGPVGSLASAGGDVTRPFTAKITGPQLPT